MTTSHYRHNSSTQPPPNRPCADGTEHDKHTWGWPVKQCEGLAANKEHEVKMATSMARLFHEEELARRQANEALWSGEHPLHLVLTWDVLPQHIREEKTEAMLEVFRWVNGQISGTGTRYSTKESKAVVEPHEVRPQPHHRRPARSRVW